MSIIDLLTFIFVTIFIVGFIFLNLFDELFVVRRKKLQLVNYKMKLPKYEVDSKKYIKIQLKINELESLVQLYNKYEVK